MFTTMPEILRGIYFQQRLRLSGHLNMLQLIDEEILFIRQAINCALLQSYRKPRFPHLLFPGSCAITATSGEAFESPTHDGMTFCLAKSIYTPKSFSNCFSPQYMRLNHIFHAPRPSFLQTGHTGGGQSYADVYRNDVPLHRHPKAPVRSRKCSQCQSGSRRIRN